MLNLLLIWTNFVLLLIIILFIHVNYSFCFAIEINYLYINVYLNYISLWFIFFMSITIYFLVFLLSNNCISYQNYFFIVIIYLIIYINVTLIIIIEDFMCFMVLFESLFFFICIISLFFNFNNSFVFAIFYLIIFSSISSILCIAISIIIISYFNILNLNAFLDICFFDSLYLTIFIWFLLFVMFAINYPIWPFHIWLPEMHVEVNTEMSVLLASIVLNIGFFGIFNFLFISFTTTSLWFLGFIDSIIMLGLTFLAISILFTPDYNNIIANWSVIHTGIGLILLWHNDLLFIGLIIMCNIAHILSASFMFITIGYMYDNYGVSIFLLIISFFGVNIWSSLFLCLFLFNIDFPFMLLFYIDIFLLYGLISFSFIYIICFFVITLSVFISSIYIYICLSFFTFVWTNNYISLDININDVFLFIVTATLCIMFYYIIYLIF